MRPEFLFLIATVWGAIGVGIGVPKGQPIAGGFLGFLLGPLGILLLVISSGKLVPCPSCCQKIKKGALTCKHCGTNVALPAA
jgi:hypothetical protein